MVLKGLGSALVITAAQSTTQFIMCVLSSKKSVNCPQHPLVWSRSPETPTANIPCTQTALTFAAPNSQSSWYKPPTTAIARSCPSYLSHSNTHCHYYDQPALYSCPMIHEESSRVNNGEAIEVLEGGVRRDWERSNASMNL